MDGERVFLLHIPTGAFAMMSRLRWKTIFLTSGLSIILLVGPVGFLCFCLNAALRPLSPPALPHLASPHDGLVVLTGGEDRITTALHLLQDHPDLPLLISGVAPQTHMQPIIKPKITSFPSHLREQITLGRRAIGTVGNVRETEQWAHDHHLTHIVLITSTYHMPRALLEFHYVAPHLDMTPYPVRAQSLSHLWNKRTWAILTREYIKLLGAIMRSFMHTPQHPYDLTP